MSGPCSGGVYDIGDGGGGGGGGCFVDAFDPAPNPWCYAVGVVGVVGGGGEDSAMPPCDIQLHDAQIPGLKIPGTGIQAVHSYFYVEDRFNAWHVLEGVASNFGKMFIPGFAYLTPSDTATGTLNIDHPLSNHVDYDSANDKKLLSTENICDDVDKLIDAVKNFPKKKLRYDALGKLFPNSNSFARYLSTFVPNLDITSPSGAVGWPHHIFGR